jgi:hypothetical protein
LKHKVARKEFVAIATVLIALNFWIFITAYPETSVIDSGCCAPHSTLAKDFSAFYTGAWRLLHDPAHVYTRGFVNDGEYRILPQPETYKYLPSFLLMMLPLLLLPYHSALVTFDVVQLLLLPLIALLVYELVKDKGFLATVVISVIALLLPLPLPTPLWSISASYYWQWAEGQTKVLDVFLLLLALYFARTGKPRLSGVVYATAWFDPRFALLALPLFILYNKAKLRSSLVYGAGALIMINLPLLYPPIGVSFVRMAPTFGLADVYFYSLIPILTLVSLMVVNRSELWALAKTGLRWRGSQKET